MSDALQRLIEQTEKPLSGAERDFLDEVRSGLVRIRRATVVVPEDLLDQDKVSFVFDTDAGGRTFSYSAKLNGELLRARVQMDTPEKEAIRLGKLLLDNLRYPDARYGKDFTDSVLWQIVDVRFGGIPLIRQALDDIPSYRPYEGESLLSCADYLKSAIDGVGNSLVLELGYADRTAFSILAAAVYYMLDRRHHISTRRILFPK